MRINVASCQTYHRVWRKVCKASTKKKFGFPETCPPGWRRHLVTVAFQHATCKTNRSSISPFTPSYKTLIAVNPFEWTLVIIYGYARIQIGYINSSLLWHHHANNHNEYTCISDQMCFTLRGNKWWDIQCVVSMNPWFNQADYYWTMCHRNVLSALLVMTLTTTYAIGSQRIIIHDNKAMQHKKKIIYCTFQI